MPHSGPTAKDVAIRGCLDIAIGIVEVADNRAMAADGPVSHVRDEMSDAEWRQMYMAIVTARQLMNDPAVTFGPKEVITILCSNCEQPWTDDHKCAEGLTV